jgi:hypothetical protein
VNKRDLTDEVVASEATDEFPGFASRALYAAPATRTHVFCMANSSLFSFSTAAPMLTPSASRVSRFTFASTTHTGAELITVVHA